MQKLWQDITSLTMVFKEDLLQASVYSSNFIITQNS